MKTIIQTVSFLALALVFGGITASAQNTTRIDANVPFDFIMGDHYFSAGEYVIRVIGVSSGGPRQVELRSKVGEIVYTALVMPNGDRGDGRSELVFDRTGDRAVLTKILTESSGYSVPAVDISGLAASAN